QRFTHTHIDNIGEWLIILFFCLISNQYYLVVDFISLEVSLTIHIACGTIFTGQTTPDLRTYTSCHPTWRRNQNAFNHISVVQRRATLNSLVRTHLRRTDSDSTYLEVAYQRLSQCLTQICHVVEICTRLNPQPFIHLFRPEPLFAHCRKLIF